MAGRLAACVLAPRFLAQVGTRWPASTPTSRRHTLSADFSQVVRDRDDGSSTALGRLSLSRPDRFGGLREALPADHRRRRQAALLYDSDLEQVTVRPLEQGLGSTPAMLLSARQGGRRVRIGGRGAAGRLDVCAWREAAGVGLRTGESRLRSQGRARRDGTGATSSPAHRHRFGNLRRNAPLDRSCSLRAAARADVSAGPHLSPGAAARLRPVWIAASVLLVVTVLSSASRR